MTSPARGNEVWAAGERYEPYVGRWSRRVARVFLEWLAVPAKRDWLDVGCGTGALTQTILEHADPSSVLSIDASPEFVAYARAHTDALRATLKVADACDVPLEAAAMDAAVSGLVLNFVPDPLRAVAEMVRVVRRGGVVAAYVWDYAAKMELIRKFWDAAIALDKQAVELDEAWRVPLCQPAPLSDLFAQAGLGRVEVRPIDVVTRFRNFDEYWTPFLGGQGPAPGYAISLHEERRKELRDRIQSSLPIAKDGSIDLSARAWAVRGTSP